MQEGSLYWSNAKRHRDIREFKNARIGDTVRARIAIDARWLVGGIGTYTRHLLRGLKESGNGFLVRGITREQHKAEVEGICDEVSILNAPIYTAREQWMLPHIASGHDLLHVPHYNAPVFAGVPFVITLHDVIHLSDPSLRRSYKSRLYAWPMLRIVTRRAQHVITVSEYSRKQIINRLRVPPAKVTAIHNGVNRNLTPLDAQQARKAVAATVKSNDPYVLYVGSLKTYKNVSVLLKAFAQHCRGARTNHRLLIVGDGSKKTEALMREAAVLGIASRIMIVHGVEQSLLCAMYSAAEVFVMPSTMEGFGLPVIEAMACGTPVISSDATCLPEVGADAAVYFDPRSAEQLERHLAAMLASSEMRQRFREKGLQRARQFTWQDSVKKHMDVYREVLRAKL